LTYICRYAIGPLKGGVMKRTMIYLDDDAHMKLKYRALEERVTMAELIRRAVEAFLKKSKKGGRRR
jgi:hypothetical protein